MCSDRAQPKKDLRSVFIMMIALMLLIVEAPGRVTAVIHIHTAKEAFDKAQSNLQNKHGNEAIEDFRLALQIEPTYMDAFAGLVEAYTLVGNKLEESATLTRLLEIEPDRPADRVKLGRLLLEQQQPQRALAQFSSALSLQPGNADALFGFATAAKKAGLEDRAAEALESGKKQHPNDPRFR